MVWDTVKSHHTITKIKVQEASNGIMSTGPGKWMSKHILQFGCSPTETEEVGNGRFQIPHRKKIFALSSKKNSGSINCEINGQRVWDMDASL